MTRTEALELVKEKMSKWSEDVDSSFDIKESDTFKDWGMDSLDVVDMTVELERELDRKFDERIYSMQTVGELIDVLTENQP